MRACRSALVALLIVGGCHAPQSRAPLTTPTGALLRLGWITWSDVNEVLYCNRRLDDAGNAVGVLGPCWRMSAGEPPKKILSWLNAGRPDERPPNAVPWSRCTIELRGSLKGDSQSASATLVSPTGREPIEAWTPDASVAGDLYAVELSFSPEGKWLAIVRLAVHLGEGERIVEIPSVDIRPVPACR
jgi:hypothetical protein